MNFDFLWLVLALLAPLGWAISNVIDTIMRRRFIQNDLVIMWAYATFRLPLVLLLFAIFGFEFPAGGAGWAMLGAGMLWTIAFIPYFRALKIEEPSRVALFLQLLSVFTLVFGYWLLGEVLTARQGMAFGLLFVGGILAGIRMPGSMMSGKKISKGFWRFSAAAFFLMMIAAPLWAYADVVFKDLASNFSKFIPAFSLFFLGSFLPGPLMLAVPSVRRKVGATLAILPGRAWALMFATLVTGNIGSLAYAYALILGKVALTSVLTEIQPLFVFLIMMIFVPIFPLIDREDTSMSALFFKGVSFLVILAGLVVLGG